MDVNILVVFLDVDMLHWFVITMILFKHTRKVLQVLLFNTNNSI